MITLIYFHFDYKRCIITIKHWSRLLTIPPNIGQTAEPSVALPRNELLPLTTPGSKPVRGSHAYAYKKIVR